MKKDQKIQKGEGKEVKLRCIVEKRNSGYVGLCLEFSLAVKSATLEECKKELERSIEEYIKTISALIEQHKKVGIRSVEYYSFKRIVFDIKFYLYNLCNKKDDFGCFVKKTVVPLGV